MITTRVKQPELTDVYLSFSSHPDRNKWQSVVTRIKNLARREFQIPWADVVTSYVQTYTAAACTGLLPPQDKRLLLVGTGPGLEVRIAHDLGINVHGVEIDTPTCRIAHEAAGVNLVNENAFDYFNDPDLPRPSFDAIASINTFTPAVPTLELLKAASPHLLPEGCVFITPDYVDPELDNSRLFGLRIQVIPSERFIGGNIVLGVKEG